jgi:carbonic anhydrase
MTQNLSRRKFLAGVSAASLLATKDLHAQQAMPTTPDAALQRLMEGNRRFAANQMTSFADDLKVLRDHTVDKQEPFAAVLSCADSRVPVELIFDQTIGHIFVTRVAGNFINAEIMGSLEYGAAVLGVKVLLVLGHGNCGALTAATAKKQVPGLIASFYPHLEAAVAGGGSVEEIIKRNAVIQANLLAKTSTVLGPMVKEGKLKIQGAYFDLASGKITLL